MLVLLVVTCQPQTPSPRQTCARHDGDVVRGRARLETDNRGVEVADAEAVNAPAVESRETTTQMDEYAHKKAGLPTDSVGEHALAGEQMDAEAPSEILAERTCGPFRILWKGSRPPEEFPPRYGTTTLELLGADGSTWVWPHASELFFSDWSYEPCSPDGRYVALLSDHYGPIHIVATENLGRYFAGERPMAAVSGVTGPTAHVHSELRWIDGHTLVYAIGGSPAIDYRFDPDSSVNTRVWPTAD